MTLGRPLSEHFPGSVVLSDDGRPVPLVDLMAQVQATGTTIRVVDGRLHARPPLPTRLRLSLIPWRDVLLATWAAHETKRGKVDLWACTECKQVTITKQTARTKDRKKYKGGPACRMTPGCPGRHDQHVPIPWAEPTDTKAKSA